MFEATLKQKLKNIFDLKKVTLSTHGGLSTNEITDSKEQETLFVEVQDVMSTIKQGVATARVVGKCSVFGNSDKIPYAYFAKKIQEADPADTKDFFFYDMEKNAPIFQNITERSFSFLYLFSVQYDPNHGTLTNIEVTE